MAKYLLLVYVALRIQADKKRAAFARQLIFSKILRNSSFEADDYRILNDSGKPYLYPAHLFRIVDPREPDTWTTVYGEDGERYSYPRMLNEARFCEDYFDDKQEARARFGHVIKKRLEPER